MEHYTKMSKQKAKRLDTDTYSLEINYDEHAIAKKLIKFIPKEGTPFEISAEDMISFLVNQVNMNTLEPTFVETDKINMTTVGRQIEITVNRDIKNGETVRIGYSHPYPLEFALLEKVYNICTIDESAKVVELSKELIDATKEKITPEMEEFTKKFYAGHQGLKLGNETKI